MASEKDTTMWLKFFIDAGIPSNIATEYAITFVDNRIRQNMLLDLNKEYLKEMGITMLGDIIAILKHAKTASINLSKERVTVTPRPVTPPAEVSRPTVKSEAKITMQPKLTKTISTKEPKKPIESPKKITVVNRILEHYVRKDVPSTKQTVTLRLGNLKRKNEDVSIPTKKTVFQRLGENIVSSTTPEKQCVTLTMDGKRVLSSRTKESLPYKGILKQPDKRNELPNDITPDLRVRLGTRESSGETSHEKEDRSRHFEKPGKNVTLTRVSQMKKVRRINTRTGEIIEEVTRPVKSDIFDRLG